jgi:hypothetical protein
MLRDFLKSYEIVIDYSSSDAFKSTDMMKMFSRLFEEMLRKTESNADNIWDLRLAKIIKAINERIISYLKINSSVINFEKIQKTSSINFILLHLSDRDIRAWHDSLITSIIHCNHVRVYLNHKAKVHDMIQVIIIRRKENEVARYNREIFKIIHHFNDLIMLWQKNTAKLKSRWRDFFKIQSYVESHEVSFTLVQLNDRKIREFFHDDHLKTFISRTDYLARETVNLSQQQNIRKSRAKKRRFHEWFKNYCFVILCFLWCFHCWTFVIVRVSHFMQL